VYEDLQIANMTVRPRPRPDGDGGYEPNGAAAKAGLSILRAGLALREAHNAA
jgi:putative transposase